MKANRKWMVIAAVAAVVGIGAYEAISQSSGSVTLTVVSDGRVVGKTNKRFTVTASNPTVFPTDLAFVDGNKSKNLQLPTSDTHFITNYNLRSGGRDLGLLCKYNLAYHQGTMVVGVARFGSFSGATVECGSSVAPNNDVTLKMAAVVIVAIVAS